MGPTDGPTARRDGQAALFPSCGIGCADWPGKDSSKRPHAAAMAAIRSARALRAVNKDSRHEHEWRAEDREEPQRRGHHSTRASNGNHQGLEPFRATAGVRP
jgi:hypothetical protein